MNNIKRLLTVLLCAALLSTCVFAQYVDPYRNDCTLTVRCKHEVEGVLFSIWQVGKIDQNAGFTKTSDFAGARVNLNNTGDWADLAETLAGFAESRKIDPLETDDTNKQGRAVFRDLRAGLYLVVGQPYTVDNKVYQTEPFLVSLPTRSDNTQPWDYDVLTAIKASEWVDNVETDEVSVLKIWSGDDDSLVRPASITVQLLQNGLVYDTVTLNRRNNWEYQWTGLPAGSVWRVAEVDVPEEYFVLVRRNDNDFVIINTYENLKKPQIPEWPGDSDIVDIPDGDVPLDRPTLPETGTTQWIVPLLLSAGMVLFLMGLLRRRQEG